MGVSENFFKLLKERGMTQKEFSKKSGIPESTISDWKRKGNTPASDKISIICEVLEVSPYQLLMAGEIVQEGEPVYVIDKGSKEGIIIETVRELDAGKLDRLIGYLEALKTL